MTKIAVFGAGTWGIALARLLAANGRDVTVWSAIPAELKSLSTTHRHPNLPGMELPAAMHYTADIAEALHGPRHPALCPCHPRLCVPPQKRPRRTSRRVS